MKINKKVIKQVLVYALLIGIAIGLLFIGHKRQKNSESGETYNFTCDFEVQDSLIGSTSSMPEFSIPTIKTSQQYYLSGNKSLVIPNYMEFYELVVLPDVVGPSNISFEFYRRKGSSAYIALQGKQDKMFYYQSTVVTETVNEEWELLKIRAITSMDFKDSILLYIHNPEKQTCYFDDLTVSVEYGRYYPTYKEEPLIVFIEPNQMLKLEQNRKEALNQGILTTDEDSWVSALVYGEGKMMHAEVRLKGDWLDHLIGDKISLRIKLKYDSWKGMRVFSIQTPYSRGFTNEWIMHQACHHEDILTTRYGFVPVYINGRSVGIYAYEEHFQKELIEASKRREGPIIKFSEEDFWFFMQRGFDKGFPYEQSVIEPFSEAKISEDTVQYRYFVNAQNLLQMFRNLDAKASDIFDVKKMAKYIAFLNSKNSVHALIWHNMRFYYNPVLCRLEPIVFDMYPGPNEYENNLPIWTFMSGLSLDTRANSFFYLMSDTTFKSEYLSKLDYYTFEHDFKYFKTLFSSDYQKNDSLLRTEFVPFYTDTVQFSKIKKRLIKLIPDFIDSLARPDYYERISMLDTCKFNTKWPKMPELYADKYLRCFKSEDGKIFIRAYLNQDFTIVGTGDEDGMDEEFNIPVKRPQTNLVFDYKTDIPSGDEEYLYFKLNIKDTLFKAKVYPWPAPTNFNPRNHMAANAVDLSKYTDSKTKTITFSGDLSFDNNIYIPAGYKVVFKPGTKINLTKRAAFVSCSVITMNGSKEAPIKIYSSDKSANGFTILQSPEKCLVNYVTFENMNTMNYMGWFLTGAVTFYESDVEISNTVFKDNHCEDMLNTIRSNFYVHHCSIQSTYGDSYDSDFCTGTVDNCTFTNNGNDAIDFSTSEVIIKNTIINGCVDKGISVGENTKATINNVKISNVNIGVAGKDLSKVKITNLSITKAVYGFVLLQKKPEYGPSDVTANNVSMTDVGTSTLVERGSVLTLNGKVYKGTKPKLYALFYE